MSKIIAETRFQVIELDISQRGQVVKQLVKIPRSAARVKRITAMTSHKEVGNYVNNRRFYGLQNADFALVNPTLTSIEEGFFDAAEITNMSFEFTISAGATEKTYYAQPVRLGLVNFLIDGEQGGFKPPRVVQNILSAGWPAYEQYYLWESNDFGLNSTITVIPQ